MKYRRKPEIVEALRWEGDNLQGVINFIKKFQGEFVKLESGNVIFYKSSKCELKAIYLGNYIVEKNDGDLYTFHDSYFHELYELERQ